MGQRKYHFIIQHGRHRVAYNKSVLPVLYVSKLFGDILSKKKKFYFGDIIHSCASSEFHPLLPLKPSGYLARWPSILLCNLVLMIFTLNNACLVLAMKT